MLTFYLQISGQGGRKEGKASKIRLKAIRLDKIKFYFGYLNTGYLYSTPHSLPDNDSCVAIVGVAIFSKNISINVVRAFINYIFTKIHMS